jgi:hypothetical protein
VTVGVKFIALPPGGWSRLESRSTTVTVPLEETTNGVPAGVGVEVGEDRPDVRRRSFDVDLGVQFVLHEVSLYRN